MAYVSGLLAAGLGNSSFTGLPVLLVSRPGLVALGRAAGACNYVPMEVRALDVLPLRWVDGASNYVGLLMTSSGCGAGRSPRRVALFSLGWESGPKAGKAGRDSGKSGGGDLPEGSGFRKRAEPTHDAHACCCYGSELCAGVSSMSPAASPAAKCPGARRRAEPGKAGGPELRRDRAQ